MATTEPQKWSATLGASADVNSLPATTPAGSGRASTSGLFPQITQKPLDEGGIAPERADFNALFKYLGDYIYYVMQGGVFSYLSTYAYTAGNLAMFSGAVYECIAANGPGNVHAPTDTAYWRKLATLQDIPPATTVNDGQLTINVNNTPVATFTANQEGNTTANITIPAAPTKTSQLQNDSGFITASSLPTVNNGTLTIQQNGVTVGTFTANQSGNTTVNVTGGGEGTFSGTILGGFVGSASQTPGTYSGIVGTEYDIEELFQKTDNTGHQAFAAYPAGTKFECVVSSRARKESGGTDVYIDVTNGAFKLKSLGTGGGSMIRYLLKRSAPTVGSTVTSDSDRYITDSNTVWVEDVTVIGGNYVSINTVLPSGTSYVVDSILATYEHPGSGGGSSSGWAGGPCYKCVVHAPS